MLGSAHRTKIEEMNPFETGRTFRDYNNGHEFVSMLTGKRAINLPMRWFDIEDDGTELILHRSAKLNHIPELPNNIPGTASSRGSNCIANEPTCEQVQIE